MKYTLFDGIMDFIKGVGIGALLLSGATALIMLITFMMGIYWRIVGYVTILLRTPSLRSLGIVMLLFYLITAGISTVEYSRNNLDYDDMGLDEFVD